MPLLSVEVTTTKIPVLVIVNTLQTCVKLHASIGLCSLSLKTIYSDISKNQVSAIPLDIRDPGLYCYEVALYYNNTVGEVVEGQVLLLKQPKQILNCHHSNFECPLESIPIPTNSTEIMPSASTCDCTCASFIGISVAGTFLATVLVAIVIFTMVVTCFLIKNKRPNNSQVETQLNVIQQQGVVELNLCDNIAYATVR